MTSNDKEIEPPLTESNTHSQPQTRWRIRIWTATWMSYAGFYFCRKAFGIVKPVLKEDYQFTDLELAHIWSAFLVAYMLGQFLSAALGRRLSCRILLLCGMAVSLLANLGIGWASTQGTGAFWWFVGFMVVNGFAQATGWPGNVGLLAQWSTRNERGRLMALWGTCYQIGSILAKHFAAFMLAAVGIAWSFWGASVVLLGVWVLFYFWGQNDPEDVGLSPFVEEIQSDPSQASTHQERPWGEAVKTIVALGLLYFCFKLMRYALDSWAPILIRESFSGTVDAATAGHLSTAYDWVGFLGVIVAGFMSDKYFKSQRMPVVFFMTVGTFVCMILWATVATQHLWLFIVCLALLGFMMLGPDSLISGTAAMDVASKEMAVVATGLINGLGSIGPVVQEELIGHLKTNSGNDAVFMMMVIVAGLAVIGSGMLWRNTKKAGINL